MTPYRTFHPYNLNNGDLAMEVAIPLRLAATFPQSTWTEIGHNAPSKYVDQTFGSIDEMRDFCRTFRLPADLKQQANRIAFKLTHVFQEVSAFRLLRDQPVGYIDPTKGLDIQRAALMGELDALEDYAMQVIPSPPERPTVAIVASAGNHEMHSDPDYIPRVAALCLGVGWACEAADLKTVAALTRGAVDLDPKGKMTGYRYAINANYLVHPALATVPQSFACALHVGLWQTGALTNLNAADDNYEKQMQLFGYWGTKKAGHGVGFLSRDGGNAVEWARAAHGADIVIAISAITDSVDADIQIAREFDLDAVTEEIISQAGKLKRK